MWTYILTCVVVINIPLLNAEFTIRGDKHVNFIDFGPIPNIIEYLQTIQFGTLPLVNITKSPKITSKCRLHSSQYFQHLENLSLWAVKMYDSSAKLPSGILNGNLNHLGDFDECINSHSDDNEIIGQYCLANFQIVEPSPSKNLSVLYNLLNSHFVFRNKLDDPGHLVPRFSSINWAVCVPSSCTHKDVEIALQDAIKPLEDKFGLSFEIRVFEEMCQVAKNSVTLSAILGCLFFISIIIFTIIITFIDVKYNFPLYNINGLQGIVLAFSLRRTLKSLFSLKRVNDDIYCVHGLRFFGAILLLIAHYEVILIYIPFMNRTSMAEIVGHPWTVLARTASLYTDTFLMFSGMLTIYASYGQINRGEKINFVQEYISRLIRIIPPLAAVILFCGFVQPLLGSGPFWKLVVGQNAYVCRHYGWRNLLFIQNYFGFENMCGAHTHHVGLDGQFFFATPLFLWILWKWQTSGVIILMIAATLSTILRFYVAYTMELTTFVYFGMTLEKMFDTANYLYTLPTHRATVYIIGVLLGYFLRNIKNLTLTPLQLKIGNRIASGLFGISLILPSYMSTVSYKLQPIHGALYAAFVPILWCSSIAWIILTQHFKYYNKLTKFLSWRGFIIFTRLSYAVYLIQFPVYFFIVGTIRNSGYFHIFKLMPNIGEIILVFGCSIILTLLFDMPFQSIRRTCFRKYENRIVNAKDNLNQQTCGLSNNNNNNKKTE